MHMLESNKSLRGTTLAPTRARLDRRGGSMSTGAGKETDGGEKFNSTPKARTGEGAGKARLRERRGEEDHPQGEPNGDAVPTGEGGDKGKTDTCTMGGCRDAGGIGGTGTGVRAFGCAGDAGFSGKDGAGASFEVEDIDMSVAGRLRRRS